MNLASQSTMKVLAVPMLSSANSPALSASDRFFAADNWRAASCQAGPMFSWVQNLTAAACSAVRLLLLALPISLVSL